MLRKTLTILSILGLLLSVALWGASYWGFFWRSHDHTIFFGTYEGAVQFALLEFPSSQEMGTGWHRWGKLSTRTDWVPRIEWRNSYTLLILPFWVIMILFSIAPVYVITPVYRRRRRKNLGLCLKCGYDIRASEERCPECGTTS